MEGSDNPGTGWLWAEDMGRGEHTQPLLERAWPRGWREFNVTARDVGKEKRKKRTCSCVRREGTEAGSFWGAGANFSPHGGSAGTRTVGSERGNLPLQLSSDSFYFL